MKKTVLTLVALLIFYVGQSQTFTSNFITYNVTSIQKKTVDITDYNNAGGTAVNIPETVTHNSIVYKVTTIGFGAFSGNSVTGVQISSVTFPDTIVEIGKQSFQSNNLTSIILPSSLKIIGDYAFQGNDLELITIPEDVTTIGKGAFRVNPLEKIIAHPTNPPTITTLTGPDDTFDIGGNRSNIDLLFPFGTEDAYVNNTGALWTGFKSVSEFFINNYITYQVTSPMPYEVKTIDYDSTGGSNVVIINTVTHASTSFTVNAIDDWAFYNNNLTGITIPNSILTIGDNAFRTNNITNFNIPNSVTSIGKSAFKNNSLANIVIPNSVTDIDENAFEDNQLTSVTLSNALTEIKPYVFQNNLLASLTIPSNVTIIQKNAFLNNKLTSLTIPSNVGVINQRAFKENLLSSLTIENGLHTINQEAFRDNQLTTLTIPSSVSLFGNACFLDNSLTNITAMRSTAPNINTDATWDTFAGDRSGIDLTIPAGSMASYVTGTNAEWTGFNSVTEDASLSTSTFDIKNNVKLITSDDQIEITTSNNLLFKSYSLYNINGSKIKSGKESNININRFSKGIYILNIAFDKGQLTKKFIK
ncbi:leucine-rich repeat domain-containing protein [Polaribacter porphyrae]|uniref:Secretion system C-terminal sorting domain-containing protein n=1 Tax=Polaribacter porphyrae TaxID=1137780 RepID=A0A2S7WMJ8_9FLAO|nr:leucine-rich repeat domain-containing protein [Polaribacter porphyrae]PQJ78820.1 hypothetical protein BTO18_06305 [Polaribacter porphyrae]